MNIRVVRVAVHQPLVTVRMAVRLVSVPHEVVRMAVMIVVHVAVRMLQRFVNMRVHVALADM